MNEKINPFLLALEKVMSEMDLRQRGFKYSASGPFSKIKNLKE